MDVKRRTKDEVGAAKTLCSPFDQPEIPEGRSQTLLNFDFLSLLKLKCYQDQLKHNMFLLQGLYVLLQESLLRSGLIGARVIRFIRSLHVCFLLRLSFFFVLILVWF